jgi:two-component system, OmpR family, response regulator MprA
MGIDARSPWGDGSAASLGTLANSLVTRVGNVVGATGTSQARLRSRVHTDRMRILVVDDDRSVRESLRRSLAFNGYQVELASDGQAALDAVLAQRPDAMVLDVMMPRLDGLEVCRRMRAAGDELPILVLTARDAVSDRVAGLDAGADDYLPKPFALEELLARLRALLRRRSPDDIAAAAAGQSKPLEYADLSLDPDTREVRRGDRPISLTRTEFTLLELLLANPRRVLTRSQILEQVWGYDFPTTGNALEVYVGYLRRKTEAEGEPRLIHTVRGVGYVLRDTPP